MSLLSYLTQTSNFSQVGDWKGEMTTTARVLTMPASQNETNISESCEGTRQHVRAKNKKIPQALSSVDRRQAVRKPGQMSSTANGSEISHIAYKDARQTKHITIELTIATPYGRGGTHAYSSPDAPPQFPDETVNNDSQIALDSAQEGVH